MKCPKCSYISFDYNLSCPKCNKDISSEQEKMHIPAFRPDPPLLLGALTGEANESQVGATPAPSQISFEKEADISLDDSESLDSGEHALDDSSEINLDSGELSLDDTSSISLDTGEVQEQVAKGLAKAKADEGIADSGEFKLDESGDDLADFDLGEAGEEDLSLDVEEKTLDVREKSVEAASAPAVDDSDLDITLDLEEEKAEDPGAGEDLLRSPGPENTAPELEPLDLEPEETPGKEEIELSLDDLKVNDTGELELGAEAKPADTLDNLLEMDEIKLEEIPLTEIPTKSKREGRVIHTAAPNKKAPSQPADDDLSLDLEDLDLELENAKPQ